jgi:hypothetical protein
VTVVTPKAFPALDTLVPRRAPVPAPRRTFYERVDGGLIAPELGGVDLPVAPKRTRDWVKAHGVFGYATLAAELDELAPDLVPPAVRKQLVAYVKDLHAHGLKGRNLLIVGGGKDGYKKLTWAATAVINEIVTRFHERYDVSSTRVWLKSLAQWVKKDQLRFEAANPARQAIHTAQLALIDNPQRGMMLPFEYRLALEEIYEIREQAQLPTITTLAVDAGGGWPEVEEVLGAWVTAHLRDDPFLRVVKYPK